MSGEIRFLGDLQRVDRRPGDLFVLSVDQVLSMEQAARIRSEWKEIVGDERLLIVTRGYRLGLVGETDPFAPATRSDMTADLLKANGLLRGLLPGMDEIPPDATMRENLTEAIGLVQGCIHACTEAIQRGASNQPIDMVLHCPACHLQHVDAPEPENDWTNPPHRTHKCSRCDTCWRPADVPTNGVRAIVTRGQADTWPRLGPRRQGGFAELLALVALAVVVVVLCFAAMLWVNAWSCNSRWKDSGIKSRHSLGGGCQIQRKDGTWIPDKVVREVQP